MAFDKYIDSDEENSDSEQSDVTTTTQKQSLIAKTFSTKTESDRKDISDWTLDDELVQLAYSLTSPSAPGSPGVRDSIRKILPHNDHMEWYSVLQIALGHAFAAGDHFTVEELQGDSRPDYGMVPVLSLTAVEASDIIDYITFDSDVIEQDREEYDCTIYGWDGCDWSADDMADLLEAMPSDETDSFFEKLSELEGVDVDDSRLPSDTADDSDEENTEEEAEPAEADD